MRERYLDLVSRPGDIEDTLRDGARRLREEYAIPLLAQLREAVGLRDLSSVVLGETKADEADDRRRWPASSSTAKPTASSISSWSKASASCCRATPSMRRVTQGRRSPP